MTFATLILDSLYAGLVLIAAGWARTSRRQVGMSAAFFVLSRAAP